MAITKRETLFPTITDFLNDDFWNFPTLSTLNRQNVPAANIAEDEKEYRIEMATPGVPKENIHVHVENNTLVVEGENKYENQENDKQYTRKEFGFTSFQRTFRLPENVKDEQIKAECNNGIVSIHIPKKEQTTSKKREISLE